MTVASPHGSPHGMVTSVERIWLLRPFLECARKHEREGKLLDQLDECVRLLWQSPRGHGLNLEQVRVCGSHPILSARITQKLRLILVQLLTHELGLLYFDNHDEAYAWVDRNAASIPSMLGRVEELRRGEGPISGPSTLPRAESDDPVALRDADEFSRMLEGGVARYLTYLDDDQRRLVNMTVSTTLLVKGGAGTGKTAVAVHRLKDTLQQPELDNRPVLYLCYNHVLGECVAQILDSMFGGKHPEELEIATLHHWCRSYLASSGLQVAVAESGEREAPEREDGGPVDAPPDLTVDQDRAESIFYGQVFARLNQEEKAALGETKPQDVWREITYVIKGNGLKSLDGYLSFNRQGWKPRLKRAAREVVWNCHERLAQALAVKHVAQWEDVPILVRDRLADDPSPTHYRAVVVDEAQDFGPVMLDVAQRLAGGPTGRLTIFADPCQDIYNRTSSLPPSSPLRGATRWLRRNYRNSAEIFALAQLLLQTCPNLKEDLDHADAPLRHGPKPTLVVAATIPEEAEEVCARLAADLVTYRPEQVAVLCPTRDGLRPVRRGLEARGIPIRSAARGTPLDLDEPSVKLLTAASAKGLDFPVVYLVHVSDRAFGPAPEAGEAVARKRLYVALTRASEKLVISTTQGKHHPLLEALDPAKYEVAGSRGQAFVNLRGVDLSTGSR